MFFDGLIGARPSAASSDDAVDCAHGSSHGDRVHPATKDLPARDRTGPTSGTSGRPDRPGRCTPSRATTRQNAPAGDGTQCGRHRTPGVVVPGLTGRALLLHRDGRRGRHLRRGFREHLRGALRWTARLAHADCKATINGSYKAQEASDRRRNRAARPANRGESHGLVTAPNGRVLYIGRGDCRTDSEARRAAWGCVARARAGTRHPDWAWARAAMHIYDPARPTGHSRSGRDPRGQLTVFGNGGKGGESTDKGDHKMEYGLLGIAFSPGVRGRTATSG